MLRNCSIWILGCLLLVIAGCSSGVTGGAHQEAVGVTQEALSATWTNVNGVNPVGNSLTKTAADGWNAGASSNESLSGDGYIQFTTGEATTHKMAGLTHTVADSGYATIDYAIYMIDDGNVDIYEDGALINGATGFGTYAPGDVFSIQVSSGVVTYLKNGVLLYTSAKAPTFPLVVDCSLYSTGATVNNVNIFPSAFWQNAVGVTVSANSITKTGSFGWNAGASSVASLAADGYVQFTTGEATTHKMCGLTHTVTDSGYATIDFGIYLIADGTIDIYQDGVLVNQGFGSYVPGDVFKVQVTNGVVTYLQNGVLLYTSTNTPTFPLSLDCSLYSTGATINNAAVTATPYWQNEVGVTDSGHSLTKIAGPGWNAGASTIGSLVSDGNAQFTTAENNTHKMAGLTHTVSAGGGYATIDFAIYMAANGNVYVYEDGVVINQLFGTYAAGDVFRVQSTGGVVTYLKNGVVFYTSANTPTFPLYLDASLYSNGATVNNATLAANYWQNELGVADSGDSITKITPNGWNAGASTVKSESGDSYVEFTTAEANTHKMAGLTHTVSAGGGYATIDFAIYMAANGNVYVYEDGVLINQLLGTYAAGDVFRVQVTGGVVTYLKNGTLLYTSANTPTFPLVLDASLYSNGATVQNVTLSP